MREQHGDALVEIKMSGGYDGLLDAARVTKDAMHAGEPAIFQAAFFDKPWRDHADFLERVESPSQLGEWSYEPVDTKLARSVKPYFVKIWECASADDV